MKTEAPAYKRIVLKLSGEALQERGARRTFRQQSFGILLGALKKCTTSACKSQS